MWKMVFFVFSVSVVLGVFYLLFVLEFDVCLLVSLLVVFFFSFFAYDHSKQTRSLLQLDVYG